MQVQRRGGRQQRFSARRRLRQARTLRWADGPDEVHRNQIAKYELARIKAAVRLDRRSNQAKARNRRTKVTVGRQHRFLIDYHRMKYE